MRTKKTTHTVLYVPTLGTRHVLPKKDSAAYCGADAGSQHFPHDHRVADLYQRCLQKYMREVLKLGDLGR